MTGEAPFRRVYIHGLVRDADKQKMSKTKGNVIDPIEMIDKYGTDAVRFALVASAGQGSDVVLSEERIAGCRAFANKIWNALRFVGMSLERAGAEVWTPADLAAFRPLPDESTGKTALEDRWIFSRLDAVAAEVNDSIEKFRYHEVANTLYHFFWHEFCDWYIEFKKLSFRDGKGLTNGWKKHARGNRAGVAPAPSRDAVHYGRTLAAAYRQHRRKSQVDRRRGLPAA